MLAPMPDGRPTRLVYAGTPEIAVGPLRALHRAGFEIACVVTGAYVRRGRGSQVSPSPVKVAALELGLPVVHDVTEVLGCAGAGTLGVVVAYGSLVPHAVLARVPMINAHYSLLPRWRGAAPVERAILEGDHVTGVCIMRVVDDLDAGEVYSRHEVEIGPEETADGLRRRLDLLAQQMLVDSITRGSWVGEPQVGASTYARKITTADRRLRVGSTVLESRRVRIGGAFLMITGQRVRILSARIADQAIGAGAIRVVDGKALLGCGDGSLELLLVRPEGKSEMTGIDWMRGRRDADTLEIDHE